MYLYFNSIYIIQHKFIVMKIFNVLHRLITDGDVIKDQAVYQTVLHPPQQLWLVLQQSNPPRGGYANVL